MFEEPSAITTDADTQESQESPDNELIAMAEAFMDSVMMVHGIQEDLAGLSLNVLRCPDTHRMMAIIITPCDQGEDNTPIPRYKVDPGRIRTADMPKIALAS